MLDREQQAGGDGADPERFFEPPDGKANVAPATSRSRIRDTSFSAVWLGRVAYPHAWEWQRALFEDRLAGRIGDTLLLLEHPPTYTFGRRSRPEDLLLSEPECAARGIGVHHVDRGGRATYHGPGQLVGYPIVALGGRYDVLAYLRSLEDVLIRLAADFGVTGERDARHTGVWVRRNKIAAIGVKITRGITMHGFAFNVATDLTMFGGIVPCGIDDRGVTSVRAETGVDHSVEKAAGLAAGHMAGALDRPLTTPDRESLLEALYAVSDRQGLGATGKS